MPGAFDELPEPEAASLAANSAAQLIAGRAATRHAIGYL
jgi:hypothetical protein